MCREGGCGACIVSVRALRHPSGNVETFSVNSCLVLVFSCNGWEITTIEGLGNRNVGYSEEQTRVAAFNATQCGYCTPGWIMQLHSLRDKNLTMAELERSFGSNTCRCTGIRPLLDTIKSFAVDASPQLCQRVKDIEDLTVCNKNKNCFVKAAGTCERKCSTSSHDSDWSLISELNISANETIVINYGNGTYIKVYTEDEIFIAFQTYGTDSYMLVDGNTGKGTVETFLYPKILIDISDVVTLKQYDIDQNLVYGANISLQDTIAIFRDISATRTEFTYLSQLAKHIELVAHIPVRKIGSLAGNLMLKHATPSYQSDIFLLLEATGATLTIRKDTQRTSVTLTEFLAYDMRGALIVNIEIPPLSSSHVFRSYKIMPRSQNALAIVNAAFLLNINSSTNIVEKASIIYGNISASFIHAVKTELVVQGVNIFESANLQKAVNTLNSEINPVDDPSQPTPDSRRKLAVGLFYKFILNISPNGLADKRFRSGKYLIQRPISHGTQDFQTDPTLYPLNQPVEKLEGLIQSSGEAVYANDLPPQHRDVFGAFVLTSVASGQLDQIDASEVLKTKGVLALFTAKDIPGINSSTSTAVIMLPEAEEVLVSCNIKYCGQPVAIIVAETEELAAVAAKQVKVTYKNVSVTPPVLTIEEASGDVNRNVSSPFGIIPVGRGTDVRKIIKGTYKLGSQYHYFMETVACVVKPVDNSYEVTATTQWMDLDQIAISQFLGINESKLIINVRRIGGGFGGKITRSAHVSCACALVAMKLNRTCRFILPMQTNMGALGKRLATRFDYEVGVDNNGVIQYLNADLKENKGYTQNEAFFYYLAAGSFGNCYRQEFFELKISSVLTDLPSNTFCRAPGTIEAISAIEHIMEHIAFVTQKDPLSVRRLNMKLINNEIPGMIDILKRDSDFDNRVREIVQFNQANRWMKRALVLSVMEFPITYFANYNALVSIYSADGTVTVTSGGIEMGQGLNTKVAQVCASQLDIPLEYVSVVPSVSFVSANNLLSGASLTTESICYAVTKACDELKLRLAPIRLQLVNPTWKNLVKQAGLAQVDLTAKHFTDVESTIGRNYSSFGVAATETQLDVITGKYEVLRTDILEDVGLSTNPNTDVGQVEGAYVQGLGLYTSEKLIYDQDTGKLLTNRSLNYHVPLALDIPADLRVKLKYNSRNLNGVTPGKAVGEMATCLAHGVTHALRKCIYESRKESGYDQNEWIDIDIPYDNESVLKALNVKLIGHCATEPFIKK